MSFGSFRDYVDHLEKLDEIRDIEGCDWNLEIGTLTELVAEQFGPALRFDKITGYPVGFRILANPYASPKRTAIALGFEAETGPIEVVSWMRDKLKNFKHIEPVETTTGSVMENIWEKEKVDLEAFPAPRWHELDGGRYLGTGCVVITRDLEESWTNLGTYRIQVHDGKTAGIYISPYHHGAIMMRKYWANGESCPVAVAIGVEPSIFMSAIMNMPWGTSEYDFAGWLANRPIDVLKGKYSELMIPANAEIVIEGEIPPMEKESHIEGPFGEYTGYYGGDASSQPVIKVKQIMFRNNPIIDGQPPLSPPYGEVSIAITGAPTTWNKLEAMGITGIKGVYVLRAAGGSQMVVVSIKQLYAGHAKQVGMAASSALSFLCRFIIVVDEDIDPADQNEVLWAIATRCEPAESIDIISGCPSGSLDPRLSPEKKENGSFTGTRAIIYAVKPFEWFKDFPRVNKASDELRKKTTSKWAELFTKISSGP